MSQRACVVLRGPYGTVSNFSRNMTRDTPRSKKLIQQSRIDGFIPHVGHQKLSDDHAFTGWALGIRGFAQQILASLEVSGLQYP